MQLRLALLGVHVLRIHFRALGDLARDAHRDGRLDDDPLEVDPLNPQLCGDEDADTCDDCSQNGTTAADPVPWADYTPDVSNDGSDPDGDSICDAVDT